MILYRWQGHAPNFGDELNTVLWPRLLPGFFDADPSIRLLGIGSILDGRHVGPGLKVVAGAGYGGYDNLPRLDKGWIIHWVRGPRTAACLGLPLTLGLGDPAELLPLLDLAPPLPGDGLGFMPHFESAGRGVWGRVAAEAGVTLIDPRADPLTVTAAIRSCRVLISEALHGVIAADALRVPWVAIEPLVPDHRAKWLDWADALDLTIRFHRLGASTTPEWLHASRLRSFHLGRRWLACHADRLAGLSAEHLRARAAAALRQAADAAPQLSSQAALDRSQTRMMEALRRLRLAPACTPDLAIADP